MLKLIPNWSYKNEFNNQKDRIVTFFVIMIVENNPKFAITHKSEFNKQIGQVKFHEFQNLFPR